MLDAPGRGGTSVYGMMFGDQARYFEDEFRPTIKHDRKGLVCMANAGSPDTNSSQFFFTLRGDDLEHLDDKHTIFGEVGTGMLGRDLAPSYACNGARGNIGSGGHRCR